MSCSSYGSPLNYSGATEQPAYVYHDQNPDPMQNLTNYGGYNQMFQLNLDSLMPASWNATSAANASQAGAGACTDSGQSDWYRYAPDKQSVDRYITSSGSTRFSSITRNPNARLFGQPNLLRTNPPVPLSNGEITFNNSENRQALIDSLGCGSVAPGCS